VTEARREPDASCAAGVTDDPVRLAALAGYGILDTDRDPAFDDIAELAAELLDAPVAVVNFIAADRQWFKAERGIGVREMPLDVSICRHVFLQPGVTVVPDLRDDLRFGANPLVAADGGLRFYAGAALWTAEGHALGTVCVLDTAPRPGGLLPRQERALRALAAQVMAQLEARRAAAVAREEGSRFRALFEQSAVGALHAGLDGTWTVVNRRFAEMLGYGSPDELVGRNGIAMTHPDDRAEDRSRLARLGSGEVPHYHREKRYLRRDGTPLPVAITVSLIRDAAGVPTHCSAVVEDLSARRTAEAAAAAAARRSAFLLELETRLGAAAGAAAIADAGAEAIGRHLHVARVAIGDVEATGTHVVIRRDWTDGHAVSVAATWFMDAFGPGIVADLKAGRTLAIPDLTADPRSNPPAVAAAFAGIGTRAMIVVPSLRGESLVAMLLVHHPVPRDWTVDEVATVEEVATRLSAALDRARAEAIEAEHTRLLEAIAGGTPLRDCLSAITDAVTRLEPSTRAAVLLADAGRRAFESTVAARIPGAFGAAISGAAIEEFAIGTCGTAVHLGEPVVCADIANEGSWAQEWRDLCLAQDLRAVHSEPIEGTDGVAVASLALYLDAARHPTARERLVARFAARLAAFAIERDRADRALRVRAAHQGLLFRVLDMQRRTDDADAILRGAAEALGAQLGADRTGFFEMDGPDSAVFAQGWSAGALPLLEGAWPPTAIAARFMGELRAGRLAAFADAARDAVAEGSGFGALGVAAGIAVPIRRDGGWRGGLYVHAAAPRAWTPEEIALVRDVAEQSWDAVERARAEAALRRLNESLESRVRDEVAAREAAQVQLVHAQRMEALGQLAGGIAHDFNNVLQAVQGGARLIQAQPGDAARTKRLAMMIADAAGRGASITRRLLAFARRGDLRAELVDAASLLGDLRDILAHTLGAGIGVRVQVPAGLPPLLADKAQLETVLVNLAANARDAMHGAGALTLSAVAGAGPPGLAPGSYVRLSVSDTGTGMDAATLARASEPFFTTKPVGQGTGLGLAMARGFAEQSNGALEIKSAPGRGTTVRLWFPVAEGDAVAAAEAPGLPAAAPDGVPRVLLVDDEALVREITAQGLEAAGFVVHSLGTSAEALELLHGGERVDLLVSDLSMPGMDGLKLIAEAQRARPGLPAILLTGFATDAAELAMGGALTGSFSLLRKPVEAEALAERASVLLRAEA